MKEAGHGSLACGSCGAKARRPVVTYARPRHDRDLGGPVALDRDFNLAVRIVVAGHVHNRAVRHRERRDVHVRPLELALVSTQREHSHAN